MKATKLANDFAGAGTKMVWFGDLDYNCYAILKLDHLNWHKQPLLYSMGDGWETLGIKRNNNIQYFSNANLAFVIYYTFRFL